jgi:hypothetical protein
MAWFATAGNVELDSWHGWAQFANVQRAVERVRMNLLGVR